ncbi:MAG: RsmD family RNA methyltransferase, partial [Burkholderiales bacterium]
KASELRIEAADAIAWMKRCEAERFELVFIDPPFDSAFFVEALSASVRVIVPQGFIYLESPASCPDALLSELGLAVHRHARAGHVHSHLLRRVAAGGG